MPVRLLATSIGVIHLDTARQFLPSACPVKGLLHRVTELLYLVRPPALS